MIGVSKLNERCIVMDNWIQLISDAFPILGALGGAFIGGYFTSKSQKDVISIEIEREKERERNQEMKEKWKFITRC